MVWDLRIQTTSPSTLAAGYWYVHANGLSIPLLTRVKLHN